MALPHKVCGRGAQKKPAVWVLKDAQNKVLARGEVAVGASEAEQQQSAAVPKAGLYWLEFSDPGAGISAYSVAREHLASLPLRRGIGIADYEPWPIRQSRFFYVPKGTKQIQYFTNNWDGLNKLAGPEGKTIFTDKASASFQSVAVPAVLDGKVWSLQAWDWAAACD